MLLQTQSQTIKTVHKVRFGWITKTNPEITGRLLKPMTIANNGQLLLIKSCLKICKIESHTPFREGRVELKEGVGLSVISAGTFDDTL